MKYKPTGPYNPPPPPPAVVMRNRLEPRPRKAEFERSLRAEVRDALWLLTRQWQFGEFKGDDAGSPLFAKVHMQTSKINRYASKGNPAVPYNDAVPLEARVEREEITIDAKLQVQIGQQWFRLLNYFGRKYNTDTPSAAAPYTEGMYEPLYLAAYPTVLPAVADETDADLLSKAYVLSNERARQLLTSAAGRIIDGRTFYEDQVSATATKAQDVTTTAAGVTPASVAAGHKAFVQAAAEELLSWFDRLYTKPEASEPSAWDTSRMEYQFACTVPNANGSGKTVLGAEEYYHGELDWYSFDIDHVPDATMTAANANVNENVIGNKTLTLIPAPLRYDGMPNPRYWEFEDARVDLGNVDAHTTDTAKILLTEFALVYSGDWFIMPFSVQVGSMCEVKQFQVKDVFGQMTNVQAAGQGADDNTSGWRMFTLTKREDPAGTLADTRLFIPPVIAKSMESDPVESINFLRDEMANMVWAVEDIIPDSLGGGMKGFEAANDLVNFIATVDPPPALTSLQPNSAEIKYKLGSTVPENWIPFVPVHVLNSNTEIQLRRATMPRVINNDNDTYTDPNAGVVRPRGKLLLTPPAPYHIPEEEVPRAGTIVTRSYQRTRWTDGAVITWLGRRKQTGRGEGSSGLIFDQVVPK